MGLYTEGLKVSIRRKVRKGTSVSSAYGFVRKKLTKAMKTYEKRMRDIIDLQGDMMEPQQKSLMDSLETVRQITAAILLDLDTLQLDKWEPEP